MALRLLTILLFCNPISLQAGFFNHVMSYFQSNEEAPPPTIKVLIVHDKPGVILEVKGKYKIFNPHTNEHISSRFVGKRKMLQAIHDGIKWGEEFPGIYQLKIVPDEMSGVTMVDDVAYRGPIFIYDIGGAISIVNEVYIEDYLTAILDELPKGVYSDEVLAAITIAARTNAYFNSENPKSPYWSVDGQSPPYRGFISVNKNSPIDNAIRKTRFMILSRINGQQSDKVTPFPLQWSQEKMDKSNGVASQITLTEAQEMSKKGDHAAQLLNRAFPGTKIELMHYAQEPK